MPAVTEVIEAEDQSPYNPASTPVVIAEPEYKSVVVDTRHTPRVELQVNIEGSPWVANYFSQVLAGDSVLSGEQVNRDPIYQQYRLIQRYVLRVTSPLSTSQDEASKSMMTTGTANVYSSLIPNEGDMFLADIGDGQEGVFRVTATRRLTIYKESCYEVDYVLIDYATEQRRGDLNSKVVQRLVFVQDFMYHGQDPIIQEQDFFLIRQLQDEYFNLLDLYFRMFSSKEYLTLLVPEQDVPTYDHFLMKAVQAFFNTADCPRIASNKVMNCDDDQNMAVATIWESLIERDRNLLGFAATRVGLMTTRVFAKRAVFDGIYFSGLRQVVYPKDPPATIDSRFNGQRHPAVSLEIAGPAVMPVEEIPVGANLPYGSNPLIHPVLKDDYYVFSQAFYERSVSEQSKLELAVQEYLDWKTPSRELLLVLSRNVHQWDDMERFYYVPVLLMLMRAAIRSY